MVLKFLRKRKNMRRIMWALAILIIPAFVIWGAGTSAKNKGAKPDYAGKIFGKKISYDDYYSMWKVARDYAVKSMGNNAPEEFISQLAWHRIIMIEAAKRENITVTDKEVVEKIASFPAFQRNGSFDKKLYKSMLQDTARAFEEKLRDDLLIAKLRNSVTSGITITDEDIKTAYREKNEKIKSSYGLIPFTDFEKDVQYTDQELSDFYEKNKEAFRKGEEVNAKYIEIPLSDPGAEETAYKILDQVRLKNNLEEPAKENSLKIKETGFFSANEEAPGIGWSFDFIKTCFELEQNQINNALIKTEKGLYIIQLKEKKAPYIPDYAQVKDDVKKAFIKEGAVKISGEKTEKIYADADNRVKAYEKFEDIMRSYDIQLKQTDFIGRGDYAPEIGPAKEFVDMAFSVDIGKISKPLKILQGWVIIEPLEIKPVEETKFSGEKDKFRETFLAEKKEKEFNEYFQDMVKRAGFVSYTDK